MSLNNNNRNNKKKNGIYAFLDRQGFYIILLLCVSIVGVTAMWVSRQEPKDPYFSEENWRNYDDNNRPDVTLVDQNEEEEDQVVMGSEEKNREEPNGIEKNNNVDNEENNIGEEDEQKIEGQNKPVESASVYNMIMPVQGEIGLSYAEDHLVFHKTLNQWRTHRGIDIHAKEGTPVKAVLDGEVIEVITDRLMGIIITIQHDENLLTRYSNLSTGAMVSVGEFVKKGQVISAVGKTSIAKSEEGPLLHFQVINDTKLVNPLLFLPNTN